MYHARLVAKGFRQIPGLDFTDNYAPVVNNVTFRVVVAMMLIENLKQKVVDIDNAFLNGDLEYEIYMEIPEGYDEVISEDVDKEDCSILSRQFIDWFKQQDNFGRQLLTRCKKQDFSSVKLIHACCTEKMKEGFVSS